MFNDPSAKVFAVFLETLTPFVTLYSADVSSDWLYISLTRLFTRVAAEQFSSVLGRLNKVLAAVR